MLTKSYSNFLSLFMIKTTLFFILFCFVYRYKTSINQHIGAKPFKIEIIFDISHHTHCCRTCASLPPPLLLHIWTRHPLLQHEYNVHCTVAKDQLQTRTWFPLSLPLIQRSLPLYPTLPAFNFPLSSFSSPSRSDFLSLTR